MFRVRRQSAYVTLEKIEQLHWIFVARDSAFR
jgi:hypothetical protein